MKSERMKYYLIKYRSTLLLFILILSVISVKISIERAAERKNAIQDNISNEIIRFHVIANSNSRVDQSLKYTVKNELVTALSPKLENAADINEARVIIEDNLAFIKATATEALHKNGFEYPVTVSLGSAYFPLKRYGDLHFPPGHYEALRVYIGRAQGENWWCVMFPPLCFVDETYSIVDTETDTKIKSLLTEEEYNALRGQKIPIKIKFKLFDAIKKLFS